MQIKTSGDPSSDLAMFHITGARHELPAIHAAGHQRHRALAVSGILIGVRFKSDRISFEDPQSPPLPLPHSPTFPAPLQSRDDSAQCTIILRRPIIAKFDRVEDTVI